MTRRHFLSFILGVLVVAATTHAVIAVSVANAIDPLYSHRIFDVHKWPGDSGQRLRLSGTYLRERISRLTPPVTVFAGSSVTHGYPWTQRQTFAYQFGALRGAPTVNAGILALDWSGVNDWIVCSAIRNAIHVETLVLEVPVVNTVSHLVSLDRAGHPMPTLSDCGDSAPDPSYAALAASRPLGLGWAVFLWEEEAYSKVDSVMRIAPVPAGYFTSERDFAPVAKTFETQITEVVRRAAGVATRVYVFPSPVFAAGLAQIGEDANAVRQQMRSVVTACRGVAAAGCVDTSALGERQDYFINFTHLNQAGHRALAAMLHEHIR